MGGVLTPCTPNISNMSLSGPLWGTGRLRRHTKNKTEERRSSDDPAVHSFVWVDSWQQQCCGDEFQVGSSVIWNVTRVKDSDDWITTLLGPNWGDRVQYAEDHHGVGDGLGFV